jgi:hypothetical protein
MVGYQQNQPKGNIELAMFIIFWILCGITCAVIASSKNKNPLLWGILGCILGIFAIIIICAVPAERSNA